MNIIFMRHGEATDNVREIISDREIYWSTLTENGKQTVLESIKALPPKIDKIYVSPFPRTIETAHYIHEKFPTTEVVIEKRLHEINHGKYSGKQNNSDLDETRIKQIAGDYFVRFGEYGENKYDIELRLCQFLHDIYTNNFLENTIVIVSHGSITSYMKRILNIKTPHLKTGKLEEFINVDFKPVFKHLTELRKIKDKEIAGRITQIEKLNISKEIKNNLIKISKKEFNNIEYSNDWFKNYIDGLSTKNLICLEKTKFIPNKIILVCFYNDFEEIADKWINHYINIGIKNFVMIDNNSKDESTLILKKYTKKVNIDFWKISDNYNCYKMCGWKQQILEFYGINKYYLTVDSDELFIYKNYKENNLDDYLKKEKCSSMKGLMLDVYPNKKIFDGTLEDFKYVDKGTYKITNNVPYYQRIFGGPRSRIFGINPSLQKIPFIFYTGKELYVNDHYYYPWNINKKAKLCSYLLHYKFLPGDAKRYAVFVQDGRHWNGSHEYKKYESILKQNGNLSFYNKQNSILIDDIEF